MWGILLGVLMAAAPPPAPDKRPTDVVAVAPLQTEGKLPLQWQRSLQAAVDEGLERGRFSVHALHSTCVDAACWAARGREAQATFVVVVSVAVAQKVYTLDARLVQVQDGSVIAHADDTCEVCGLADAQERTRSLVATLRDKVDSSQNIAPRLLVQTRPSGARVTLDGEKIGTSPVEVDASAGVHRLRVELDGHVPLERDLALVRGVDESISLELTRQEPAAGSGPTDRPDRGRPLVIGGWTALGVGLAGIASGAALLVINDEPVRSRCSGEDRDGFGSCRYLYDTKYGGIALVAGGAALTMAGAALLGVGYRRRRARVAFGPRSAFVEVRF